MDRTAFQDWLDDYVEAWRTYETGAIGALFSDDAKYRWYPWDEPAQGREAIVAAWLAERDEPGSWTAEYRPFAVEDDACVALGVTRYLDADRQNVDREYQNVFLCRFDADGRCREFTEVYAKRARS